MGRRTDANCASSSFQTILGIRIWIWRVFLISWIIFSGGCGATVYNNDHNDRGGRSSRSISIPPHILDSLKNATTFAELERRLKLTPSSSSSSKNNFTLFQQGATSGRTRGGGVGGVAPGLARTRTGTAAAMDAAISSARSVGDSPVAVIDEPKQSRDSCKIVDICVPMPVAEHTGVLLFPKCIELPQCLGGCCDSGNDCHPTRTEAVKVKYKRWRIVDAAGQGMFKFMEENLADMTRHTECGCGQQNQHQQQRLSGSGSVGCQRSDGEPAPVCDGERQELVNCQCRCKEDDRRPACGAGTAFNPTTCSCDHVRNLDDSSTTDQDDDDRDRGDQEWQDGWDQHSGHNMEKAKTTPAPYRRHVRRPGP